jgi:hypothetical protein
MPVVPDWLQVKQQDLATRTQGLLDRESLSPEQRVQELNPEQQAGIQQLIGYGDEGSTGGTLLNTLMGGSEGLTKGMDTFESVLGGADPQNEGIDMNYVNSLINNDVLGGQIDAATRDVERQFSEVDAPQSRMMQALSGGTGSTRGAIGDAILQRGAMDRTGDIAGSMRGRAFGQALGLGGQQASQNASLAGQTRGQNIGIATNMSRIGLDSAQMGNSIGLGNINALMQGGGMNQAYEQALNDVEYENWQRMYGDLEQAGNTYSQLGAQYTGVQGNSSSTSRPNYGEAAMAGASTLGSGLNDVFDSWGGGGNDDAFNFDDGGFYNPQLS